MARRADLAALHLPGFPLTAKYLTPAPGGRSVALLPFTADTGTAAGDLEASYRGHRQPPQLPLKEKDRRSGDGCPGVRH